MATTPTSAAVPKQLYPLSTQDGSAIPHDVIRPSWYAQCVSIAEGFGSITLPNTEDIITAYATDDMTLSWAGGYMGVPIVDAQIYLNTLFLPAHTQVSFVPPDTTMYYIRVKPWGLLPQPTGQCMLYLQGSQRWASLSLPRQAVSR